MTNKREYYSARMGKPSKNIKIDLPTLKRLFGSAIASFIRVGDFEEAFGLQKTDRSFSGGIVGGDIEAFFLRRLHKENLWPIEEKIESYSEDDVFDLIELLYDVVSERYKYRKTKDIMRSLSVANIFHEIPFHIGYDKKKGRERFRNEINDILCIYEEGYILSDKGEILLKGNPGHADLLDQEIPVYDQKNVNEKVKYAVLKFRRHRASIEDKREAVRILADVLEFLRPEIKKLPLKKDEGELFYIANEFGIRHHKPGQKTEYDQDVYLEWFFYSYLSTIQLVIRIIQSHQGN